MVKWDTTVAGVRAYRTKDEIAVAIAEGQTVILWAGFFGPTTQITDVEQLPTGNQNA